MIGEAGQAFCVEYGFIEVGDFIDEAMFLGEGGGEDASVHVGGIDGRAGLQDGILEALVHFGGDLFHQTATILIEFANGGAEIGEITGANWGGLDILLFHGVGEIVEIDDDTDAADDGSGVGEDGIAGRGEVVGSTGTDIENDCHDRFGARDAIEFDFTSHEVAGGYATAGAIDADDERADGRVTLGSFEFLMEEGDGVLSKGFHPFEVAIEEDAIDIDDGDLVAVAGVSGDETLFDGASGIVLNDLGGHDAAHADLHGFPATAGEGQAEGNEECDREAGA